MSQNKGWGGGRWLRRLLGQQGFSRNNVQRGKELGLKVTRLAWDSRVQEERVAKNHFQSWGDNSPFFPLVNGENRLWFLGLGMASTREQVFKKKKKKAYVWKTRGTGKGGASFVYPQISCL